MATARVHRVVFGCVLALTLSCSGGGTGGQTGGASIGGAADDGATRSADPEARLRSLVEEVVGLAENTDCPAFGATITAWTDDHRNEIGGLIQRLEQQAEGELLAELDAYVEERRLVVLEAAADCGDQDDAWPAWQTFEQMVDEARR